MAITCAKCKGEKMAFIVHSGEVEITKVDRNDLLSISGVSDCINSPE